MEFIDDEHELFFASKLKELSKYSKGDVYYYSLIYTLGICPSTREHFEEIFDIEKGKINIEAINTAWQTGTSEKVTRMAFSLWNKCMYDSEKDVENNQMSASYNPSEIFACTYAPYFYEGVKLRYPEYTNEKSNERILNIKLLEMER